MKYKQSFAAFLVGFIFALGLGVSGMTQPQNVVGFLDLFHWKPALMFVMIGAISFHGIFYFLIRKKKTPLFDTQFHIPNSKEMTPSLIIGSVLFGAGWGLGGLCPGPAIVSLASGQQSVFIFVGAMVVGMLTYRVFAKLNWLRR